jgi:hypothetical protein
MILPLKKETYGDKREYNFPISHLEKEAKLLITCKFKELLNNLTLAPNLLLLM